MKDNLNYEYTKLFRMSQLESKTNLFGHAYEFAMKKKLLSYLSDYPDERKAEFVLQCIPNPADDFYLYMQDFYGKQFEQLFEKAAESWINMRTSGNRAGSSGR
jgi:hypothetical protein